VSSTRTKLAKYRAKRNFSKTAEPSGEKATRASGNRYLIQKHAASRLHYDFRLELSGVLKSWAVAKGPSLNPADRRLAMHVEDHPLDYGSFEGTIPQGQYGGGTVMLWDQGSWEPIGNPEADYARGNMTFMLHGKRLKGRWHLVKLRGGDRRGDSWLLIKGKDQYADANGDAAVDKYQTSVVSRRSMQGIAAAAGKTWDKGGARRKSVTESAQAIKALQQKRRRSRTGTKSKPPKVGLGNSPVLFVPPQLATLVAAAPVGPNWVHEIKFDGYRLLALIDKASIRLFTRSGNDWSDRFAPLCKALSQLDVHSAIVDGEVVHSDKDGSFSFHALQDALSKGNLARLRYYAFDLLHLNGVDLRARPLTDRKALLQSLLDPTPPLLEYSQHFTEPGDQILAHACHLALEGIVSKRADGPYRSGRTNDWLKSKCVKEQEFVIGGYTEQPKHPGTLGALLVGYYENDKLRFAGKVGTGFSAPEGRKILKQLRTRATKAPSFASLPTAARRGALFIKPEMVAHVNFGEWTPDGKLRHPSFQGLREDKSPREVVRESARHSD